MLASEVIQRIKDYCGGIGFDTGVPIDEETTRDKILYGDPDQECTGIVTCLWANADVIKCARELGANLIIAHEALFWNHGDHQDFIAENKTYLAKKQLLDEWGGAVWRCHDYIHSRVPIDTDGAMVDGIFYGLAWKLGWLDYRIGDVAMGLDFKVPEIKGIDLARELVEKLGLNGTRLIGDPQAVVSRVHVPMHIMGVAPDDNRETVYADEQDVDCLMTMEFIDFTTSEFVRDAGMLDQGKCAITIGHFNLEEPGMEYMPTWIPAALGSDEIQVDFVPMGDTYQYVVAD